MGNQYLVQQKWPHKWGTVGIFRSESSAARYLEDARKAAPAKLHRMVTTNTLRAKGAVTGKPRDLIAPQLFRAKKPCSPVVFQQLVEEQASLSLLMDDKERAEWESLADVPAGQLSAEQRRRAEELSAMVRELTLEQSHSLFLEGKATRQIGVMALESGLTMFVDWYHADDERFLGFMGTALDNGDGKVATLAEWHAKAAEAAKVGRRLPLAKDDHKPASRSQRAA